MLSWGSLDKSVISVSSSVKKVATRAALRNTITWARKSCANPVWPQKLCGWEGPGGLGAWLYLSTRILGWGWGWGVEYRSRTWPDCAEPASCSPFCPSLSPTDWPLPSGHQAQRSDHTPSSGSPPRWVGLNTAFSDRPPPVQFDSPEWERTPGSAKELRRPPSRSPQAAERVDPALPLEKQP